MLIPVPRPFMFLADNQAASHVYGTVGGFNLNVYYRTLLGYPDGSPARSRFCLNISLEERGSGLIAEPSDLMGNARTPEITPKVRIPNWIKFWVKSLSSAWIKYRCLW